MFSILLSSFAHAQAAAAPVGEQPSMLMSMVPLLFVFGVMYVLMLRPQAKQRKEHQKFLSELKRGDDVITTGGLLGKVDGLTEMFVTLEIASGVKVRVVRSQIAASGKIADLAKTNNGVPAQS